MLTFGSVCMAATPQELLMIQTTESQRTQRRPHVAKEKAGSAWHLPDCLSFLSVFPFSVLSVTLWFVLWQALGLDCFSFRRPAHPHAQHRQQLLAADRLGD